jgi:hypothetical protein
VRRVYIGGECHVIAKRSASARMIPASELQGEVDTPEYGAEELELDQSDAELAKMIEDFERSEVKREQGREFDEFADRIADSVAARLVDHGL